MRQSGATPFLRGGSSASNVVDAYNASLTRTTPTALSTARDSLAGASAGDYALFGGGYANNSISDVVDAYNASLTRTTPTALSAARQNLAGASVGDYTLFAGGYASDNSSAVDAYCENGNYVLSINVPAVSIYFINGVTSAEVFTLTGDTVYAESADAFSGYIKHGFTISGLISPH